MANLDDIDKRLIGIETELKHKASNAQLYRMGITIVATNAILTAALSYFT